MFLMYYNLLSHFLPIKQLHSYFHQTSTLLFYTIIKHSPFIHLLSLHYENRAPPYAQCFHHHYHFSITIFPCPDLYQRRASTIQPHVQEKYPTWTVKHLSGQAALESDTYDTSMTDHTFLSARAHYTNQCITNKGKLGFRTSSICRQTPSCFF